MQPMRLTFLPLLCAVAGCGYSSQYTAPTDGRPRAVWKSDHVALEAAGAPLSVACLQEIAAFTDSEALHLATGDFALAPAPRPNVAPFIVAAAIWTPRFYGPRIVVPRPGLAPIFPHPPLFLPPRALVVPAPRPLAVGAPAGGSGARIGDGDGRMWAILAAVALVVMPAVALGLALSRPEDSDTNAEAIDQVNVYNDLLRSAGSPCAAWTGS